MNADPTPAPVPPRPPPSPPPRPPLRAAARTLLQISAVALGIGVLIVAVQGRPLGLTLLYSFCVTFACWTSINLALRLALRWAGEGRSPGWPPLPWTVLSIVAGTFVGSTLGNLAGDLVSGLRSSTPLTAGMSRQVLGGLLLALVPGAAMTWFFHARERLAAAQAQAQAAQRLAAENQLRLLQSQLEPHMLFNTLANLRVLIGVDATRAQAMLDHLIAFLRATLAASRAGEHALADEFDRLRDYLALMSLRMGPRLQVGLDLPAALRTLPVPALLLQPLVENSIRHGLEPKLEGGRIDVAARREGDRLVLTVRDDGVGLDAGRGVGPRPPGAPGAPGGFGVLQVRERLAALHGADARFTLVPADGGGTLATLHLPWPHPHPTPPANPP